MGLQAEPVILTLPGRGDDAESFAADLSAVTQVNDELWLGTDEGTGLARLTRMAANAWGAGRTVALEDVFDLPADADEEIDVEGLGASGGFLWITGSHSRRRSDADEDAGRGAGRAVRRLGRVRRRGNRYVLARVPLGGAAGAAARLPGGPRRNALTDLLREDEHLARFLRIPGKDNGFNVEGLAAAEERVWLGLRGPVLRGWAVVLVLAPEVAADDPGRLRLGKVDGKGRYAKVFLDLRGLGVRDLAWDGDDLLILAGPTMPLRADAMVLRWRGALRVRGEALVSRGELDSLLDLPYGAGADESVDHPEGLTVLRDGGERSLLVVYDSPAPARRRGDREVVADRFPV